MSDSWLFRRAMGTWSHTHPGPLLAVAALLWGFGTNIHGTPYCVPWTFAIAAIALYRRSAAASAFYGAFFSGLWVIAFLIRPSLERDLSLPNWQLTEMHFLVLSYTWIAVLFSCFCSICFPAVHGLYELLPSSLPHEEEEGRKEILPTAHGHEHV